MPAYVPIPVFWSIASEQMFRLRNFRLGTSEPLNLNDIIYPTFWVLVVFWKNGCTSCDKERNQYERKINFSFIRRYFPGIQTIVTNRHISFVVLCWIGCQGTDYDYFYLNLNMTLINFSCTNCFTGANKKACIRSHILKIKSQQQACSDHAAKCI